MRTNRAVKLVNLYTQNQFLSTIRNNGRASYNGSIEASQASDVGSIPIARSINPVDAVGFTGIHPRHWPIKSPILDAVGRESRLKNLIGRRALEGYARFCVRLDITSMARGCSIQGQI